MTGPLFSANAIRILEDEIQRLRYSLIYAINSAGGSVSSETSSEFLCLGADQVKLYVAKLKSENHRLAAEVIWHRGRESREIANHARFEAADKLNAEADAKAVFGNLILVAGDRLADSWIGPDGVAHGPAIEDIDFTGVDMMPTDSKP